MNERRSLQLLAEKYEQVLEGAIGVHISDDIKNQIISIYKNGIDNDIPDDTNTAKLAQRFNLSNNAVNEIIIQSGVVRRGYGQTQRGSKTQPSAQKITPAQIEYIKNLISKRDSEGVFEHGISSILKMVNEYTEDHPELDWYKLADSSRASIHMCIKEWEKKNIPGETRADYGIKRSNGVIYRSNPKLPDNAGTRQIKADPLGPPPTAVGRAQKINDQEFLPPGS